MKRFLILAALASSFTGTAALADTYRYIAKDFDGAATFIDESSINRDGDVVTYWTVIIDGDYLTGKPSKVAYYTMRHTDDCRRQTTQPTDMSVYDSKGERLIADNKGGESAPIEPGTIDQDEFNVACRGDTAKSDTKNEADTPFELAKSFREAVMKSRAP